MSDALTSWYLENRRPLPWRASQDPYRIWISEIMLQQTTVQAVIPYYERFLKAFPTVKDLAQAPLEKVLEMWSGLGYYSRARNLHKAAQLFAEKGFPKTAAELTEFPGLGPYTSRAVSSIAFEEKVGVLDGNVIRILSRVHNLAVEHWKPAGRDVLQTHADALAQVDKPSDLNQAMMELGATVCTTHSPTCLLCPWKTSCKSLEANTHQTLPLKKPRAEGEIWVWQPEIMMQKNRVALVQNPDMPFLKGQWVFPGKISRVKKKPETFDLKHGITHHDIYIQIKKASAKERQKLDVQTAKGVQWCEVGSLSSVNPSILLKKVLSHLPS
ncbi:MAG: A/G-specific adenine glycosylase [Bdellovibrionaceae bacterium]|nr:A/G-specific adenine glycosylase [Pseudobdellovibrionaceae bacterium]